MIHWQLGWGLLTVLTNVSVPFFFPPSICLVLPALGMGGLKRDGATAATLARLDGSVQGLRAPELGQELSKNVPGDG